MWPMKKRNKLQEPQLTGFSDQMKSREKASLVTCCTFWPSSDHTTAPRLSSVCSLPAQGQADMIKYPEVRPLDSLQKQGNWHLGPKLSTHHINSITLSWMRKSISLQDKVASRTKNCAAAVTDAHAQTIVCKNWEILLPANLILIFLVGVNRLEAQGNKQNQDYAELLSNDPSPRRDKGLTCAPSTAARQSSRSRRVTRTICPI